MSASIEQRNQDATCYTGNLDTAVTEALLWEVSEKATQKGDNAHTTKSGGQALLPPFLLGPS